MHTSRRIEWILATGSTYKEGLGAPANMNHFIFDSTRKKPKEKQSTCHLANIRLSRFSEIIKSDSHQQVRNQCLWMTRMRGVFDGPAGTFSASFLCCPVNPRHPLYLTINISIFFLTWQIHCASVPNDRNR